MYELDYVLFNGDHVCIVGKGCTYYKCQDIQNWYILQQSSNQQNTILSPDL